MLYVHNKDCQQLITGQIVNSSLYITGQFQMLIIKAVAKTFVLWTLTHPHIQMLV